MQLPGSERDELKRLCGDVRNNVVATVQHGKTLLSDPNNAAKAKPVQESGTAVARSVKALLDAVNRAGDAGSGGGARSGGGGGGGVGVEGKSRALNDAAKRVEDIIDKVNDEINPKSKLATHATITVPYRSQSSTRRPKRSCDAFASCVAIRARRRKRSRPTQMHCRP